LRVKLSCAVWTKVLARCKRTNVDDENWRKSKSRWCGKTKTLEGKLRRHRNDSLTNERFREANQLPWRRQQWGNWSLTRWHGQENEYEHVWLWRWFLSFDQV